MQLINVSQQVPKDAYQMIISRRWAKRLIKQGKAKIECTLRPDDRGRVFVAITRYDIQRTDHYQK